MPPRYAVLYPSIHPQAREAALQHSLLEFQALQPAGSRAGKEGCSQHRLAKITKVLNICSSTLDAVGFVKIFACTHNGVRMFACMMDAESHARASHLSASTNDVGGFIGTGLGLECKQCCHRATTAAISFRLRARLLLSTPAPGLPPVQSGDTGQDLSFSVVESSLKSFNNTAARNCRWLTPRTLCVYAPAAPQQLHPHPGISKSHFDARAKK